jgi:LexA-binding, inner membrane-associated putative hydrolase
VNGTAHRVFAVAVQIAAGSALHEPLWQVIAGIPFAVAFSAGPTSPDLDDTRTWKQLDRWIPDEWLGDGGPMQHRGLLHWWGIPALVAMLIDLLAPATPITWAAWAVVVGWTSHIVADCVFGQCGYGTRTGVPVLPWWAHVGLGFKSNGLVQHLVVVPVSAGIVWWAFGMPT